MSYFSAVKLTDANGNLMTMTSEGALNIHDLDNHRKTIIEPFRKHSGTASLLTVPALAGDTSITVANGGLFSVGNELCIEEDSGTTAYEVGGITITAINTNLLTLDRPLDHAYTTAAVAEICSTNMAVSGSLASPQIFKIAPPSNENWHIDRLLISGADGNAMDDGTFIGSPALTNGVVLRENRARGTRILSNWKRHWDMRLDMYDIDYSDKAPGGENAVSGRFTLKNFDVVVELDGSVGDALEVLIQDNLSANTSFKIKAEGHFAGISFA